MFQDVISLVMDLAFYAWPLGLLYVIAGIFKIAERYEQD